MTRRAFLHVGTPKSGTSYLQDRFVNNQALLAQHGLTYLSTPTGDHFHAAIDLIQKQWAGELESARGSWAALARSAHAAPGDVLISHEVLAAASVAQVQQAFESLAGFDIHVIVTARDLARQVPAEWQEKIKHRGWVSFADWQRRVINGQRMPAQTWFWKVQHLPDILGRWSANLTPDRVHLIPLPTAGGDPEELWRRFLSVVGLPQDASYVSTELANASLGVAEIRVLRRLNNLLHQAGVSRRTYVEKVRELLVREVFANRPRGRTATAPPEMQPFFDEINTEWRDWILGSGVHLVGDLEELMSHLPDEPWQDPDQPDPNDVFDAALEALAALVIDLDQQDGSGLAATLNRFWRRGGL
ncbi:MAG TPA: hypothetical protein PLC19_03190 [Marmoricola sp.]|nr:hypothetical protein [Marmoricola sp.]HNO39254.1 hypothetical protein [Marmoricola sp.]